MPVDQVNAVFEFVGGLLVFFSVYRIFRDKCARGVSIIPVSFFTIWGFWNLYYYPHLGQFFSFAAGTTVAIANITWLYGLLKYRRM